MRVAQNVEAQGVGLLLARLLGSVGHLAVVKFLDFGAGDLAAVDRRHHIGAGFFVVAANIGQQPK